MKYDLSRHHRHSIRLRGYDYSQPGAYFVTICSRWRECIFGEIVNGEMRLNKVGEIIAEEWSRSPEIRNEIQLDEWVIMPNHMHGIVVITNVGAFGQVGAFGGTPLPPTEPRHARGPAKQSA